MLFLPTLSPSITNTNVLLDITFYPYTGLGSAYCDLCDLSKEDCGDPVNIQAGFCISRNISTLHRIFDDLKKDGIITKQKDDYAVRAGQTMKPIATSDVKSVQVLHGLLRCFDLFMKTVVQVIAGVMEWT